MAATKKKSEEARLELPLGRGKPETIVGVVKTQLAAAKSAPDLPNQPKIQDAIKASPELRDLKDNLMIDQTPEGLRIQLIDRDKVAS